MIDQPVAYSTNLAVAAAMVGVLDGAGIPSHEIVSSAHVSFAGGDQGYFIVPKDKRVQEARAVLARSEYARYIIEKP